MTAATPVPNARATVTARDVPRRGAGPVAGILLLVRRSLRQHFLSTLITVLSIALASGLVMSVVAINEQSEAAFTGGPIGFDAVLGARGSPVQLVLNTVFHLETSPGNIPWALYEQMKNDRRVALAIPYALGDNYLGFRIVGATEEMFSKYEYLPGQKLRFESGGRAFDPLLREAVIGSFVAQKTGLKAGDTFQPYHGLTFDAAAHVHEEQYLVVGVLKPTNTPNDRVIWIPIEGIFRMGGHILRGTGIEFQAQADQPIPDENKEVSAVMLKFRGPQVGMALDQLINKQGKVATLAYPIGAVMAELFNKIGWVSYVLRSVAVLVVIVAAGSILASIYNSINERRREFAILRALGARRSTVFSAIVLEAATIAAIGSLLGYLVYGGILAVVAVTVRRETGVVLDAFSLHPILWLTPLYMIGLGALAGVIPAIRAYATDVATNLTPQT